MISTGHIKHSFSEYEAADTNNRHLNDHRTVSRYRLNNLHRGLAFDTTVCPTTFLN